MSQSPSQPSLNPEAPWPGTFGALGVVHVIACAAAAVLLMAKAGLAGESLIQPVRLAIGWYVFWCAAFAAIAFAVRQPLVALLAFVALCEGTPRYFPAYQVMMKIGLLNWAAALAFSAWACHLIRTRARPAPMSRLTWLFFALIAWLIICAIVAVLRGHPWLPHPNHHPERYGHALVVFILAAQLLRSSRNAWWFCLVLCATLCIRWAVSGNVGPSPTFGGGDGDISALAVIAMPFALLGAQLTRPAWSKLAFVGFLIALIVLLSITRNRNGAVAFVVLLPAMWIVSRHKLRSLLVAAPVLAVIILLFFNSPYWSRFTGIFAGTSDANSANARLLIWQSGWRMIRANPVFGVGTGNFHNVVARYTPSQSDVRQIGPSRVAANLDDDQYAAHYSAIHLAGEAGLPGGLLYIFLFLGTTILAAAIAIRSGPNPTAPVAATLFAALCVYLAIGLFISRQDMAMGFLLAGWVAGLRRFDCDQQEKVPLV
ncbi:MAG: O-antigen ligase family protein [Phycisphaeraceae bacterium]